MIMPFMAIIMMSVLKSQLGELEGWLVAFSPLAWPFFAAKISLVGNGAYGSTPLPFWIAQGVMLIWWLRLLRKPRLESSSRHT